MIIKIISKTQITASRLLDASLGGAKGQRSTAMTENQ